MKALKFSRQRESIRECLKNRKDHPTADAVYVTISKDYPKISLGTVYRNLNRNISIIIPIPITTLCARPAGRSSICLWIWSVTLRTFSPLRSRDGLIPTRFSFTVNARTA